MIIVDNNDNCYENKTELDCGKDGDFLTQAITQNSDSYCRGTRGLGEHQDRDLNGYPAICNSFYTHN